MSLPRVLIYLRFAIHPMSAPAAAPTANVIATVYARCRCTHWVEPLTMPSASPLCFAVRLTAPTPSSIASASPLLREKPGNLIRRNFQPFFPPQFVSLHSAAVAAFNESWLAILEHFCTDCATPQEDTFLEPLP